MDACRCSDSIVASICYSIMVLGIVECVNDVYPFWCYNQNLEHMTYNEHLYEIVIRWRNEVGAARRRDV